MEYMPSPAAQTVGFIYSSGLGFALGFAYDFFRILFYLLTGSDKKLSVVRDIIYLFLCLCVNFIFLLTVCSGRLMLYVFAGEGIGLAVFFVTVDSELLIPVKKIILKIRGFAISVIRSFAKIKQFLPKLLLKRHKITKNQKIFSEKT